MSNDGPRQVLLRAGAFLNRERGDEAMSVLDSLGALSGPPEITRLRYVAIAERQRGDISAAHAAVDIALGQAVELHLQEDEARCRAVLATILADAGDQANAIAELRRCVQAFEQGAIADPQFEMRVLWQLVLLGAEADHDGAGRNADRVIELAAQLASPERRSAFYAGAAQRLRDRSDARGADYFDQKSVFVLEEKRLHDELRTTLRAAAERYRREGDADREDRTRALLKELA